MDHPNNHEQPTVEAMIGGGLQAMTEEERDHYLRPMSKSKYEGP